MVTAARHDVQVPRPSWRSRRCFRRGRAPFKPGRVRHPQLGSDLSRQLMVWYDPLSSQCQCIKLRAGGARVRHPPLFGGMGMGIMRLGRKPAHEESRSVQTTRTVFVFVNVALSLLWIRFLVRLIEQWNSMRPNIRESLVAFMVLFSLLWLTLIRDKKGYLSLVMAFGILAAVYRVVRILL